MRAQTLAIAMWTGLALTAAALTPPYTPPDRESRMVIPFAERPFERLVDRNSGIAFDADAPAQGWLTAEAAWLVWDPHWSGQVRSRGAITALGFEALSALDSNGDGELTGGELTDLSLWRDENGNGVSDPGEVLPVNVHGIAALAVRGELTQPGLVTAPHGVRFDDGRTRPLYDWIPELTGRAT